MQNLFLRCRESDIGGSGFFTATDLRQVLTGLGHTEIAEAIGMCFSRTLRHPGESYIDYIALIDSIRVRRERLLEEELWRCFRDFALPDGMVSDGRMPASRLEALLQMPEITEALSRDGVEDCSTFAVDVHQAMRSHDATAPAEVDFIEIASEVIRQLPLWPVQSGGAQSAPTSP